METYLNLSKEILAQIHTLGESAYPEEGAGLMLGWEENDIREVTAVFRLSNAREKTARHNRYLITAQDMIAGEKEADRLGLDVVGVFHSHPDHPDLPSEFDREWALPWFSYLITSVRAGEAVGSRSWRLSEDRESFFEENIRLIKFEKNTIGGRTR
ncbi:MAG: M67 family metallopeptidase [Anaerolineales bacterium]|nr:M67 family metallopeptidase [Anaerolineales bacterium]